ncbi:MAG: hypothetical protein WBB23_25570, partial [Desulforhopalus sp.]
DKYSGPEQDFYVAPVVSYTCRTNEGYRIKLSHLAQHLGTKKTNLATELFEAAIDEAIEQVLEDFEEGLAQSYYEAMQDYEEELAHRS